MESKYRELYSGLQDVIIICDEELKNTLDEMTEEEIDELLWCWQHREEDHGTI